MCILWSVNTRSLVLLLKAASPVMAPRDMPRNRHSSVLKTFMWRKKPRYSFSCNKALTPGVPTLFRLLLLQWPSQNKSKYLHCVVKSVATVCTVRTFSFPGLVRRDKKCCRSLASPAPLLSSMVDMINMLTFLYSVYNIYLESRNSFSWRCFINTDVSRKDIHPINWKLAYRWMRLTQNQPAVSSSDWLTIAL